MFPSYAERSINALTFHPADGLEYIDISLDKAGAVDIDAGHLKESSLQSWMDDSANADRRFRIVLAGRTGLSNREVFDHFPCSEHTFRVIFRGFGLPTSYPTVLSSRLAHYIHSSSANGAGGKLLSFVSRTVVFRKASHALALTYDVEKKLTSAMIQESRDDLYIGKLRRYLRERPDLAVHPAFLLLVVAQLEYEATDENYLPLRADMIRIEKRTGHGQLVGKWNYEGHHLDHDLSAFTRDLNLFSSRIIGEVDRVKSCLLRHEQILGFFESFDDITLAPLNDTRRSAAADELKQHAAYLATGWESMLHRYEAFEKNVQVQLAVLYNTAVQRDSKLNLQVAHSSASIAAASHRDGSIMKSISLLTMVFLPATFVSTLFAMPLFDWGADRISAVATPYAWVYLAVAMPLTLAVVAVWFLWLWLQGVLWPRKVRAMTEKDTEKDE